MNPTAWQQCCVTHDVAYWQGGTSSQRLEADRALRSCVGDVIGNGLGEAMYLGVRPGGFVGLPLTWRWGYGWVQNRGYHPLTPGEQSQVNNLLQASFTGVTIQSEPIFIAERLSLHGNYCLDEIAMDLANRFGDQVKIIDVQSNQTTDADGYLSSWVIKVDACARPYIYDFLLLRADACTRPTSELLARGRIRFKRAVAPRSCEQPP